MVSCYYQEAKKKKNLSIRLSNVEVIGEFIGVNFIKDVKYQLTKGALRWRLETAEGIM